MAWPDAHAQAIRAMVAALRGDPDSCRAGLADATRRRLGAILGGDEGRALVDRADPWMSARGVRNPERLSNFYMPVFAD